MKNTYAANSMCSLKGGYGDSNYFSRSNRSMGPILSSDFESRLLLNSRMPQKITCSQEIRKNDFIVDDYSANNSSRSHNILMNCLNDNNDSSEVDEKIFKIKKQDSKNDSIKSLVSQSFKAFNLVDTIAVASGANPKTCITKTTSQQNFGQPLNKENVNYIKPWVESSCNKYYSSNSLVYAKKNTPLKLDANMLSVSNTNTNDNNSSDENTNNNRTNDSFLIKNIEYNKENENKGENYRRTLSN